MHKTTIKIDESIKNQAIEILDQQNISLDEAIHLFLQQVILTQSIPFPLRIPNAETIEAMQEDLTNAKSYNSAEEVMCDALKNDFENALKLEENDIENMQFSNEFDETEWTWK